MVNFVEAHEECSELIDEIFTNDNILEKVKGEVRAEIKRAENIVYNELEENFSEVTRAVQHKRGGYFLINRMRNFVLDLIKHGQIEFKEAKFFLHHLNKEERNLTLGNLKINFAEVEADFETN